MSSEDYYEEIDEVEVTPKEPDDKEALEKYYKNLGERIKQAREESGYTQVKLAQKIGLTPSAISNYEAGIRQIPVHILLDISKFLNKPLQYFLGPDFEPVSILTNALKETIEKFTSASYLSDFFELDVGKLSPIGKPQPLIPVPPEIAKDHHFALRQFNDKTQTYNYYICKWHKGKPKTTGFIFKRHVLEYIPPEPEDWVIATDGDSEYLELVQYKNVTPSKIYTKGDPYEINVVAKVIARVERLVKADD